MFDSLSERLQRVIKDLRGQGRLTEDNIKETLRQVRMALLEADVAVPVVKALTDQIRERALGQEVATSLTPGQALVGIVRDTLVEVMGTAQSELALNVRPPAIVLLAGLQGSGKTTSAAKLARWIIERRKKKVLVVSADVYRPAAIEQLKRLAAEVGADFFPSRADEDPVAIAQAALAHARIHLHDALIVDTAGRLAIDAAMMDEIRRLHGALEPAETLFVVDSMAGQDAANTAKAFHEALPLTGVILTKADGDARGGAALSVRHLTGKPIKFIGVGEKTAALEPFHPDRIASRILGMGDVLTLVEEAQQKIDRDKADKFAQKMRKGKGFDLSDLRDQLEQMGNMGGVAGLLDKLPGMGAIPDAARNQVNDRDIRRMIAVINSMTPKERRNPDLLNGSRKRRIAAGSGTQVQDVNRLLKQYAQMERVMKSFSKGGGMARMMRSLKGRMPPGFPG